MAFTRKFLSALGIEDDKIEQIIDSHTEVTEALKADRDRYKKDAEKITDLQNQLNEANKKLENADKDDYKEKYESEKTAHEKLKSEIQAKETTAKKTDALKACLKEKGYSDKGISKIAKYGGYLDEIELDENGKLKNSDKLISNIEAEWSEYKSSSSDFEYKLDTPPNNGGDSNKSTSKAAEIAAAYHNKLYGAKEA